jgi:hypothetical protein
MTSQFWTSIQACQLNSCSHAAIPATGLYHTTDNYEDTDVQDSSGSKEDEEMEDASVPLPQAGPAADEDGVMATTGPEEEQEVPLKKRKVMPVGCHTWKATSRDSAMSCQAAPAAQVSLVGVCTF